MINHRRPTPIFRDLSDLGHIQISGLHVPYVSPDPTLLQSVTA